MQGKLDSTTLLVLAVVVGLYFVLDHFYGFEYDSREPPLIPQRIPYIGHIIGLIRNGTKYLTITSAKYPLPIFTLGLLNGRVYVVSSPDLVAAVQNNSKDLSFGPLITAVVARLSHSSESGMRIGLVVDIQRGTKTALGPGPGLDYMNRGMIDNASRLLNDLDSPHGKTVKLYQWIRHTITVASTDAVYGPMNPISKNRELEDAFWDFEANITMLMVNIIPSITAYSGHRGREKVSRAHADYLSNGGATDSSALSTHREVTHHRYGISVADQGRFELTNMIGILVNTAPATFWTICHIASDSALLAEIREEIGAIFTVEGKGAATERRLVVSKLKEECPLLLSVYQEVLRVRSFNASVRMVMRDTMLAGRYLLKKGSILQMPSTVIHNNPDIWGPTVNTFDPRRFLKQNSKQIKHSAVAFRAFGGGSTLCPGRHFASMEILSIVGMFIMRFDILPPGGTWHLPKQDSNNLATSVLPPDTDLEINLKKRAGFEEGNWGFTLTESYTRFGLSSD